MDRWMDGWIGARWMVGKIDKWMMMVIVIMTIDSDDENR